MNTGYANPYVVAEAPASERSAFIKNTYLHLAGAIALFIVVEAALLSIPGIGAMVQTMIGGRFSWLIVLAAFMGVSYLADGWARSDSSRGMQYAGLTIFVIAEAIIFLPLIYIATTFLRDGGAIIGQAGIITGLMVAGITATAFISKKDFSFLSGFLTIAGFAAIGIIVASIIFGFDLGIVFSGAMVVFASVSILKTTSDIIHHYRSDQYVAASLALFAGVALLFWYVLQILISLSGRD